MTKPDSFPGVSIHFRGNDFAVLDQGAQPLTWTPANQQPVLWTSPLETFQPQASVRGGIPVVFPWFGLGRHRDRSPKHGFARITDWERLEVRDELRQGGSLTIRHRLSSDDVDYQPFLAEMTTTFSPTRFSATLVVTNTGDSNLDYEVALHSYLAVSDVRSISISGLDGCQYLDAVTGERQVQSGDLVFPGETDNIYQHQGSAVIHDPGWGRQLVIDKSGSSETVVWNPGPILGRSLADIGDYFPDFVCVEAANTGSSPVVLAPGEHHTLSQSLRLA